MKPETNPEAAETAKTTNSPAVVHERLVVPLPWPDSDGCWWCRQPGDGYIPGDEMCVEVTLESCFNRNFVLWRGESYGMDDGTFRNMEWIKAESPWHNAGGMARELAAQKPESTTDING